MIEQVDVGDVEVVLENGFFFYDSVLLPSKYYCSKSPFEDEDDKSVGRTIND